MPVLANHSASTYISPSSGRYNIGDTVTLGVYIASPDMSVNAVSGVLSFPKEKLEVLSVSKDGSIMSFWVQQPSFSNTLGTISYEGVVLNPGLTGEAGKILNITFKVIAAGNGTFSFSSASILANDGKGTNILKGIRNASFVFGNVDTPPVDESKQILSEENDAKITVQTDSVLPKLPVISSSTHPDQTKWYKENDVRVSWQVPAGSINVRHILSDQAKATPNITHSTKSAYEDMVDLKDGIWYFDLQYANQAGWGPIATYKIQIDTTPPDNFEIQKVEIDDNTSPSAEFVFTAKDSGSGIDYFEVQIDDNESSRIEFEEELRYVSPILSSGKHILNVKVYDKAGNFAQTSTDFTVISLLPPVITKYPLTAKSGDMLLLEGKTVYPLMDVIIYIQKNRGEAVEFKVKTDEDGKFIFSNTDPLESQKYSIWAVVVDERGARSEPSDIISIDPTRQLLTGDIGQPISVLNIMLICLLLGSLFLLHYFSIKNRKTENQLLKERAINAEEHRREISQNTLTIIESCMDYFHDLDKKRDLTKSEAEILKQLKEMLNYITLSCK